MNLLQHAVMTGVFAAQQGKETQEVRDLRADHEKVQKEIEETYTKWKSSRSKQFAEEDIYRAAERAINASARNKFGIGFMGVYGNLKVGQCAHRKVGHF